MILPHRGQDKVSAALKRHIHFTVPERDENTDQRQKIQCPALLLPGFGRPFKRVLKRRADRADDHADDYRKQAPSRKNADIVAARGTTSRTAAAADGVPACYSEA